MIRSLTTEKQLGELEVGEICTSSASKSLGYWAQPELTNAVMHGKIKHPTRANEVLPFDFLRTGDLGFMHRGELFICGRHKDMLIIRGRNIYPHDVEVIPPLISAQNRGVGGRRSWQRDSPWL
jgi:acyl-CoA synthetase (AMP-forming)/AMP-acid ligase II